MTTKQKVLDYAKQFVSVGWNWEWNVENKSVKSDSIILWKPHDKENSLFEATIEDIESEAVYEMMI